MLLEKVKLESKKAMYKIKQEKCMREMEKITKECENLISSIPDLDNDTKSELQKNSVSLQYMITY